MIKIVLILDIIVSLITANMVDWVTVDDSYLYNNNAIVVELNNHSLREVFEEGNLIVNGDFSNNTTGWSSSTATIISENGYLKVTPKVGFTTPEALSQNYNVTIGHTFYTSVRYYVDNPNTILVFIRLYDSSPISLSLSSFTRYQWGTLSGKFTSSSTVIKFGLRNTFTSSLNTDLFRWDDFYVINQSSLGIETLTTDEMDYWFDLYIDNLEREMQLDYNVNALDINDLIIILIWSVFWLLVFKFIIWVVK